MEFESLDGYRLMHPHTKSILFERRVILGLTQKQVAERAGIRLQSYQRFESGERNIMTASFQLACRVIEALKMNVSDFYHGEYFLGEELYATDDGLRYKKTGKLINEDVIEEKSDK